MTDRIEAEVVIVGSGVAGALIACELATRGVKTVVLEAGPRITRADALRRLITTDRQDNLAAYPNVEWAPGPNPGEADRYILTDLSPALVAHYIRVVGGTTWHWPANAWRFGPDDFRAKSKYGVGADWPIGYDELERYYDAAERELGIAGDPHANLGTASPRRNIPYPEPPMAQPYSDKVIAEKLAADGIVLRPIPVARNSIEYDGRPACNGNNSCNVLCPTGAQYSAIHHVEKAERLGVRLIENAPVVALEVGEDSRISGVQVRRPDGDRLVVSGRRYVLAANGIESPKLCLASVTDRLPAGVANRSGAVGRYYMDHPAVDIAMRLPEPAFAGRGPVAVSGTGQFIDGPFRTERSGFNIEIANLFQLADATRKFLLEGRSGPALDEAIRDRVNNRIRFSGYVEVLPDAENRVTLDPVVRDRAGMPRIRLAMNPGRYALDGIEALRAIFDRFATILGATEVEHGTELFTVNHMIGTMRMGDDPGTSVVDRDCRSHDHPNLFLAGSSVFPTSGGAKAPTLTIAALALRTADRMIADLATRP